MGLNERLQKIEAAVTETTVSEDPAPWEHTDECWGGRGCVCPGGTVCAPAYDTGRCPQQPLCPRHAPLGAAANW
jgi:hypothetical protein